MPSRTIEFFKRATIQVTAGYTPLDAAAVDSVRSILAQGIVDGDTIVDADMPTSWLGTTTDWSTGTPGDYLVDISKNGVFVEQNLIQTKQPIQAVYNGGFYKPSGTFVPCYWKGSTRVDLPSGTQDGNVLSIFIDGANVYAAGWTTDVSDVARACYWVNGTKVALDNPGGDFRGSNAASIFVRNGVVYTSGNYFITAAGTACYWTGTTRTDLTGAANAEANSIYVASDNTIYIGGSYNSNTACYWVNGVKTDLPGSNIADVLGIYVSGGNVYTSGYYNAATVAVPCYWTNTTKTDLPGGDGWGQAEAIFVDSGTVYTCGYYQNAADGYVQHGARWIGTSRTELPGDGVHNVDVSSIFVYNGIVYASGYYTTAIYARPCYWTGTVRTELPGNTSAASVSHSIRIAQA